MGRRRLWKAFFFVMVALTVGGYALVFVVPAEPTDRELEDLFLLPLYVAQLVGLFGFAYWRAVGTRRIWQWIFAATIVEVAWMIYGFVTEAAPWELGAAFMIGLAATLVPLFALQLVALYSYAFRADDLWAKA